MREKEWLKTSLKMHNFFKFFKLIKNIPKNSWIITKEKECPKATLKMFNIKKISINF